MPFSRRVSFSRPELALIAVTAVWGSTFVIVHAAMTVSGPAFFVGLRFCVAGLIAAMVFWRQLRGISWREIGAGLAIGSMLWLGYGLQTAGLQSISSTSSAFITAFYVPLVPLLQWLVFKKWPGLFPSIGITLAFVGLILVAGPGADVSFNQGTLLTIVSTLPIAIEIILISVFTAKMNLARLTVTQLFSAGLLSFASMPIVGESVPAFHWLWLAAAVGLGLASMLIQLTMTWAQRSVSPTRATIIYAGEPVWALLFGFLAGDRMTPLGLVGSASIVGGVLVSELKPKGRPKYSADPDAPVAPGAARSNPAERREG